MKKHFFNGAALTLALCGIASSAFGASDPAHSSQSKSYAVAQVTLGPGESVVDPAKVIGAEKAEALTFVVTPQSGNLRSALEGWLTGLGYQLAWNVDNDLPAAFNATFHGSVDIILAKVMAATSHMSTPARVCEYENKVIRVVARAANCQD